ncbi:hypothetical protein KQX54_001562 [Cotesia glomerata]|uniref:Uncharacterized protein n=1 Tax=Cotesia glomerata TaxID=32391 RepID=A0AAV7IB23_COTGL|nr:hypothetical protein KQX54_001562 [Cotesia glomerata]
MSKLLLVFLLIGMMSFVDHARAVPGHLKTVRMERHALSSQIGQPIGLFEKYAIKIEKIFSRYQLLSNDFLNTAACDASMPQSSEDRQLVFSKWVQTDGVNANVSGLHAHFFSMQIACGMVIQSRSIAQAPPNVTINTIFRSTVTKNETALTLVINAAQI